MTGTRRDFIRAAALAAGVSATGLPMVGRAGEGDAGHEPLSILILGGTGFIGPHMVREALRRGHAATLFNRGRTNAALFPDLETIRGDRDGGLDGLKDRRWDAVIDNSGYVPRLVQDSARLLSPNCDRYVFISTISVYRDVLGAGDEDSPLATIADESIEEITGETYGALKALCEQRAASEIGEDRLTILRPTLICGPGDRSDRFTYWPVRTRKGGAMLWPGTPADELQIIDARDLANFTIDCVEQEINGIYNAANPPHTYSMGQLLEDSLAVTASAVEPVWIPQDFLADMGMNPGAQLPAWTGSQAFLSVNADRALAAGFQHRPERETVRDLMAWWDTLPEERRNGLRVGPDAESEAEVIAAYRRETDT
jgi:2'-hydroxyisoflavone reductase